MKVSHKTLGIGTVVSQDSNNVTVDFNGVQKTLIIKFAGLTNEDGSAFGVAFEAKPKNVKKLNSANFTNQMTLVEKQRLEELSKMSKCDWNDYRAAQIAASLQSSLR